MVSRQQAGNIDQQATLAVFGGNIARPDEGLCERFPHGFLLQRAIGGGAVACVLQLGDNLAADQPEIQQRAGIKRAAIQPDRIGTKTSGEASGVNRAEG